MKLQVLQENLNKAISLVSRFVSPKAQLPILGNILLKAKNNKLTLAATNLESAISLTLPAKVEGEGEIGIPARTINEVVTNLPLGVLNLELQKEQLKISTPNFSSQLLGMNTADFPAIPILITKAGLKISQETLSSALNKVLFATSIDETRPILTGILCLFKKGKLILVATDGFRLSQVVIDKISGVNKEIKVVLPKTCLSEISRLPLEGEDVLFSFNTKENQVVFGTQDIVLSSRILEGEFPDWEKIIPKETLFEVRVDKEDLLRVVKLASVFARDSANVIKIKLEKEGIVLTSESSQAGSQKTRLEAKIEAKSNLDDFEIAFNFRFLEDFLHAASGDEVKIQLTSASSPAVFLDPQDPSFLHLIMPVKIQG